MDGDREADKEEAALNCIKCRGELPTHQKNHINLGDPLEETCRAEELVTVRHLLVGLDIAQFPGPVNSQLFVPV